MTFSCCIKFCWLYSSESTKGVEIERNLTCSQYPTRSHSLLFLPQKHLLGYVYQLYKMMLYQGVRLLLDCIAYQDNDVFASDTVG